MKRYTFWTLGALLLLGGLTACDSDGEQPSTETPEHGATPPAASTISVPTPPVDAPTPIELPPDSPTPLDVSGLSGGVASVAAGFLHTCALTAEGGVKCWGHNMLGQLGNGTIDASATPVDVIGLSAGVAAVVVGDRHSCALTEEGGVKCWGSNAHGQVGDGTPNHKTVPVDVIGFQSGVKAISAAKDYVCAVTTGGGVKCWGENGVGQLGDGTSEDRSEPVDVTGLAEGIVAVAAGEDHTCALTDQGAVKCWGANNRGQLGDGATTSAATPNPVPVDSVVLEDAVAAVAAGSLHTCVLTTEGGVKCWGSNLRGQLGNGSTADSLTPEDVVGLESDVVAIGAGRSHACALTAAGGLKCWGGNERGQLGDGTTEDRTSRVNVSGLEGPVAAFSVGKSHTCAVTSEGGVKCWGRNDVGQLGGGGFTPAAGSDEE